MKKEKITEVGELLEIDNSDMKVSKTKMLIKRFTYPLVQISFFIVSSISGILLGYWEKQIQGGYPYTASPRVYRAGLPTILLIHSGNAVFSIKTRKKFGLLNFQIIISVLMNLILSFLSYYFLYQYIAKQEIFCMAILYGSYDRKRNRKNQSIVLFNKDSFRSTKCE